MVRRVALPVSLALSALGLASAGPAAAQGMVRKTFDDWQLRCETPAGAKAEQCALVQYLAAEDRPNLTLVVIVLKTADNRGYLLRVVAPLGVLLPSPASSSSPASSRGSSSPLTPASRYRAMNSRAVSGPIIRRSTGETS